MSEAAASPRPSVRPPALPPSLFVRSMLAGALAMAVVTQTGALHGLQVRGVNMAPTLAKDDRVLVHRPLGDLAAGDVIAYFTPFSADDVKVGRIVALPGSRVAMDERGLLVDGTTVAEGRQDDCSGEDCLTGPEVLGEHHYFTRRADRLDFLHFPERAVPEGYVFVLNDNRIDERDSRIYGAIPLHAVVGVASFVYYASDETGIRWDRMNRRVS